MHPLAQVGTFLAAGYAFGGARTIAHGEQGGELVLGKAAGVAGVVGATALAIATRSAVPIAAAGVGILAGLGFGAITRDGADDAKRGGDIIAPGKDYMRGGGDGDGLVSAGGRGLSDQELREVGGLGRGLQAGGMPVVTDPNPRL